MRFFEWQDIESVIFLASLVVKKSIERGGDSRIPLAAEPACRPLAFSIVLTDREPGTG